MTRSNEINELAAALSRAQSEMGTAARDGTNPHFGSSYATLAAVRAAALPPLTRHGLSIVQSPRLVHVGDDWIVEVETLLLHESGQFISDALAVPLPQVTAQSLGSATTYLKRYAMASFTTIAPGDDDDGEAATTAPSAPRAKTKTKKATAADGVTETTVGRVASVARRVLPSGKEKLVVRLHNDAREYETWSTTVAGAAKSAKDNARNVELVFRPGKFALEILAIRDPSIPEPPL